MPMRFVVLLTLIACITACGSQPVSPTPPEPTHTPIHQPPTLTSSPVPPTQPPQPTLTKTPTVQPSPTPFATSITPANLEALTDLYTLSDTSQTIYGVATNATGSLVATASSDFRVRVYDGQTGDLIHTLQRHSDFVYSVAFAPHTDLLVSGGRDRTVQFWNPRTGERIIGTRTSGEVAQLSFSSDGERVAGAGYYSATGQWWAPDGGSLGILEGHTTRLRSIAFDPRGEWLATGDADGIVVLHDPQTGEVRHTLTHAGEALSLAFSPTEPLLAVAHGGRITLWDTLTLEPVTTWQPAGTLFTLAFSPEGTMLVSGGTDTTLRIWSIPEGDLLTTLRGHSAAVRSVGFSQDGATLVSGSVDARAIIWRIQP